MASPRPLAKGRGRATQTLQVCLMRCLYRSLMGERNTSHSP